MLTEIPTPRRAALIALLAATLFMGGACSDQEGGSRETARAALARGLKELDEGYNSAAVDSLREACAAAPEWRKTWAALSQAAWINHDVDEFVRAGEWLLAREPQNWPLAEKLVETALGAGFTRSAEEALSRLVAVRPNAARTHLLRARVAFERGQLAEAGTEADQAARLNPGLAEAHHILGRIYDERGNPAAAEQAYRNVLEADPGHLGARDALALLLSDLGREPEAAEHRLLHLRLSAALGRLFRTRPAATRAAQFEPLVKELPRWVLGQIELGRALFELGRLDESAAAIQAALEHAPGNDRAHQLLGCVLIANGDPEAGRRHLELARGAAGP